LRIIFAGTPQFAAEHLAYLLENQQALSEAIDVVAVYTQPDRKSGRGKKQLPPPVKTVALNNNIPVYQPLSLKDLQEHQQLQALEADLMIVAAYGMLLPQAVLDIPRLGCINVHASLLPRWRGAAPIERAIIAGDRKTGITIMQMALGLDTGDMLLKKSCSIESDETGGSLHDKLIRLGQPALLETLQLLIENNVNPVKQDDSLSCYASKLQKHEGQINWQESAEQIALKIRAFTPSLATFSLLQGERIRVTQACADTQIETRLIEKHLPGEIVSINEQFIGVVCGLDKQRSLLQIHQLQLPGKKALAIADILNGHADKFSVGLQFDQPTLEQGHC